ncbi:MAG: hydrogenase maturation protease [Tannerellaceae bacterium]|jgi:hydrogenase maturation protease|nr:hydrogenase maturation protease [Tannerellaceae bacterium]
MKTLILGVGNVLLGDEGVGIHVVRALATEVLPAGVDILDGGTGGLHLLSWTEGYERIIMIDATLDGNPPGTITHLRPRYASDFPPLMSSHEIGIRDMITAMHLTNHTPIIDLITITASTITDLTTTLTPALTSSIPPTLTLITHLLAARPRPQAPAALY